MASQLCETLCNQTKTKRMKTEQDEQSSAKPATMHELTLAEWLRTQGAVKATKVRGPNGPFVSYTLADGARKTLPIGSNSHDGSLGEFKLLITDDGQLICTVNSYVEEESLDLSAA